MHTRESRGWLVLVIGLVCVLVIPSSLSAQCVTTMIGGNPGFYVTKYISNAMTCTLTMYMNITYCGPGGNSPMATGATRMATMSMGITFVYLTASRTAMQTNPSCGWACDCGTPMNPGVSIGTGDGLPVELMDFSVEDEVASRVEGESGQEVEAGGEARREAVEAPRAAAPR